MTRKTRTTCAVAGPSWRPASEQSSRGSIGAVGAEAQERAIWERSVWLPRDQTEQVYDGLNLRDPREGDVAVRQSADAPTRSSNS
jgi:hypothetical protein